MSDDADKFSCFLTGHRGLRHNDAKGAILIVEVVAGRRLIGLIAGIYQHRADTAAYSTKGNGEFAVTPAGQIRHITHRDNRSTQKRQNCQAENNLPDPCHIVSMGVSKGEHRPKYITFSDMIFIVVDFLELTALNQW